MSDAWWNLAPIRTHRGNLLLVLVCSLFGGGVGATFYLFLRGQPTENVGAVTALLSTVVVVLGWYRTHAMAREASREHLQRLMLIDARSILVATLRKEQRNIKSVWSVLMAIHLKPVSTIHDRDAWRADMRSYLEGRRVWFQALQEYEALFPETREGRGQLVGRANLLAQQIRTFAQGLEVPAGQVDTLRSRAKTLADNAFDQIALLEDLTIHFQDRAFSALTGHRPMPRTPTDPRVPRFVANVSGSLTITVPDAARAAEMRADGWLTSP